MKESKDATPPTLATIAGGLAVGFVGSLVIVIVTAMTLATTEKTGPLAQMLLMILVLLLIAATILRWLLFDVVRNPWARGAAILVVAPIWLLAGTCAAAAINW